MATVPTRVEAATPSPDRMPTAPAWVGPVLTVVACVAVQVIGGLVTTSAISEGWYGALAKPVWTPPSWLFGPVWTALYVGMAVAACLVWAGRFTHDIRRPLLAFGLQLGLNLLWSVLFFGWRSPGGAFAEIVVLWFLIAATAVLFHRVNRWAGYLMVPYLAWVTFAAALNLSIAVLNS